MTAAAGPALGAVVIERPAALALAIEPTHGAAPAPGTIDEQSQ